MVQKLMNRIFQKIQRQFNRIFGKDLNYKKFWNDEYLKSKTSGPGSYGVLAEFKAEVINAFLANREISSVIEFGCGDGNQLAMIKYPRYLGFDVSRASIDLCSNKFKNDPSKSFMCYDPSSFINPSLFLKADLVVCLDVLYHIIDKEEFLLTLNSIFSCALKYVILYTTIDLYKSENYHYIKGSHGKHRDTIHYLGQFPEFKIDKVIKQRHPELSSADFILLSRGS
jgi:SAM-dependent methyltransferase